MKLVFGEANAKLKNLERKMGGRVVTFSVLSGHTCPYAKDCMSKAVDVDGRRHIEDGPDTEFRCFSASQEAQYPGVYNSRLSNGDIIAVSAKSVAKAAFLLMVAIPKKTTIVRIHVGGDFKTKAYFDAWLQVAKMRPEILFYAYTKSLPFWVSRLDVLAKLPNLVLTASRGGHRDDLIDTYKLRETIVVYSESEADRLGLEIDHDDSHAANPATRNENFALLIHGSQPPGSDASKALQVLKKSGWSGYGKSDGRKKV